MHPSLYSVKNRRKQGESGESPLFICWLSTVKTVMCKGRRRRRPGLYGKRVFIWHGGVPFFSVDEATRLGIQPAPYSLARPLKLSDVERHPGDYRTLSTFDRLVDFVCCIQRDYTLL